MYSVAAPPWPTDARPAWYRDVHDWLTGLASSGKLGALGSIATVKERPWSVVLRVTFERAITYFKATGAGGSHEPSLLLHLQRDWSHLSPEVLAVDIARGWTLLADAGQPLREAFDPPGQLAALRRVLPAYAGLQAATMPSIETFLHLGLPDRRLHRLPELLEEFISGEALAVGGAPRLSQSSERPCVPSFLPWSAAVPTSLGRPTRQRSTMATCTRETCSSTSATAGSVTGATPL